jgi:hypothetical protein
VRNGEIPPGTPAKERLGITFVMGAGRGIPDMANADPSLETLDDLTVKNLGNQAHILMGAHFFPVGDDNPRALLPAVL